MSPEKLLSAVFLIFIQYEFAFKESILVFNLILSLRWRMPDMLDFLSVIRYRSAASEVCRFYAITGGCFEKSFMFEWNVLMGKLMQLPDGSTVVALSRLIEQRKLKNYTDLIIFSLALDKAFEGWSFDEIGSGYRRKVEKYLIRHGIPEDYVMGDNLSLVDSSIDSALKKYLGSLRTKTSI